MAVHPFPALLNQIVAAALAICVPTGLSAGEVSVERDDATGWQIYTLRQGETEVRVVPAAGCNAFSIVHDRTQYLRVPEELQKLPGVGYGTPLLYPMPNRVRGAKFNFEGTEFEFPKNGRGNFIHGLVHSEAFAVESHDSGNESASLTCVLKFEPGGRPYELFPIKHDFRISVTVRAGAVRWTYQVDNQAGDQSVPFGVALHPYLVYQNSRDATFLRVPASHLMEANQQLPTGELLELEGQPLDARRPRPLSGYNADDVFYGMNPNRPARVEFRDVGRGITFQASKEFTHLVVWTPDRPFFGIENQTCSTDAHNLAAQGATEAAHLQVCPAGETMNGHVEYQFD